MAGSPPSSAPPSVPVALSYTSLTRLERCGYRHYLEAVLGLKEQERAGEVGASAGPTAGLHPAGRAGRAAIGASGPRAAGELAHAVLQRMDFARGRGPDATEIARRARELGIEIDGTGCKRLADLLGGLMGTELAARIAAASHLQTEQPFAFSIGRDEPLMVGTFDLCAHEQDGVRLIVDYKSGGGERGDPEEMVAEEFGAQRLIYALAALTDGAEQVEVVHWFLRRPERPVSKRYGSADMQALSGMLRERIEGVAQRGFTVSERPHRRLCDGCPGRRRLCSWTEEETLRALPAS